MAKKNRPEEIPSWIKDLYKEDLDRVVRGERPMYFRGMNDGPLKNVSPEFDVLSGGAAVKGMNGIRGTLSPLNNGMGNYNFSIRGINKKIGELVDEAGLYLPEKLRPVYRTVVDAMSSSKDKGLGHITQPLANTLYPADERRNRRLEGEHPVGYVDAIDGIWPREKYGLWGEKIERKADGGSTGNDPLYVRQDVSDKASYLKDILGNAIRRRLYENVTPDVVASNASLPDKVNEFIYGRNGKANVDEYSDQLWARFLSQPNNLDGNNKEIRIPDNVIADIEKMFNRDTKDEIKRLDKRIHDTEQEIYGSDTPASDELYGKLEFLKKSREWVDIFEKNRNSVRSGKPTVFSEYDFYPEAAGDLTPLSGFGNFTIYRRPDGRLGVYDVYDFYSDDQEFPVNIATKTLDAIGDKFDERGSFKDYSPLPESGKDALIRNAIMSKNKLEKKWDGGYIASRDNTSVGNHGINENVNLNNRVNHEYLDITDVIAGFVPVVSDIQDINDFKEGIVNKDPLAVTLSAFGLLPFVGGLFTSANKMRKIRASYKDMLRLYDEPDVKAYFKEAYRGRNDKEIKSILKEMSKDEDKVDEFYKRILQGRYQFYREDADISNHDISQIAPYLTKPIENGIGSGRHNVEDLKDSGFGVLYTTNDINKASKFASIRQRGKGWTPSENGGMGVIRIKDADFSGSRYDWIRNNPIPDNIAGDFKIRKVDNNDGTSDYIFIGEPNKSVGSVKYLDMERVKDEANKQFRSTPDGRVAMWGKGGPIDVENEYGSGKYVIDPRRSEDSKMVVYDEIWDYLTEKKGIPQTQAIGILSNIAAESGGDTEALGAAGDFGIQQWLGPRKKELQRRYGRKPTLTQQLDYLVDEYQGKVPGLGWNYMNQGKFFDKDAQGNVYNYYMYSKADFDNATNYKDATVAWNQGYGRPLGSTLRNEKRFEFADMFSNRYGVPENEPMRYEFGQRDSGTGDGGQQPVPETVAPADPSLASRPAVDNWWEKEGQDLLYKMLAQSGANKKAIEDIANNIKNDPQSEAQIAEAERMRKEQAKRQLVLNMIPGLMLNIKGMSSIKSEGGPIGDDKWFYDKDQRKRIVDKQEAIRALSKERHKILNASRSAFQQGLIDEDQFRRMNNLPIFKLSDNIRGGGNKDVDLLNSLFDTAMYDTFGESVKKGSEEGEIKRKERFYPYKLMADTLLTIGDIATASPGFLRLIERSGARLYPLLNNIAHSNSVQKISGVSGIGVDSSQMALSPDDDNFWNILGVAGAAAELIGGMDILRNTNVMGRIGNRLDDILDIANPAVTLGGLANDILD